MRPVANGRPGTQILPDFAAFQPAAAGTRNATVNLRKPGSNGTTWNEDSQQTVPFPFAPYASDQTARIQAITSGERTVEVAGDTVHVRGYLVTLDATLTPAVDDLVIVTSCDDDDLVGRELLITDVLRGSIALERDVFCTLED